MNMLPFTKPPRFPNIGLTSTRGSSGTSDRKNSLSSSVGLGIFIGAPPVFASAESLARMPVRPDGGEGEDEPGEETATPGLGQLEAPAGGGPGLGHEGES